MSFKGANSSRWRALILVVCIEIMLAALGCGGGGSGATVTGSQPLTGEMRTPQTDHVVLLLLENASYEDIIGKGTMPYLESLASQGGLATAYFGNAHPSIGNYFMLTTGQLITDGDGFTGPVTVDNLARQFKADGKSWKAYAEGIPGQGYLGGDQYPYLKHHMPFAYFSDVINDASEAAKILPYGAFQADVANGNLPNFALVVPNAEHSAHDCPGALPPGDAASCTIQERLRNSDKWLAANLPALLNSSQFQSSGLLILTFDEGHGGDDAGGGGHIVTLLVGPKVKAGVQSTTSYQHQNALRTIGEALRLTALPGSGAGAIGMGEFF